MSPRSLQEEGQAKGTKVHEHRARFLDGRPASAASKPLLLSHRLTLYNIRLDYIVSYDMHSITLGDPMLASFPASLMRVVTPPPRRRASERDEGM